MNKIRRKIKAREYCLMDDTDIDFILAFIHEDIDVDKFISHVDKHPKKILDPKAVLKEFLEKDLANEI